MLGDPQPAYRSCWGKTLPLLGSIPLLGARSWTAYEAAGREWGELHLILGLSLSTGQKA